MTTGLNPDCGMIRIMPALESRLIKVAAMVPIKANLPSRHCDKCKAEMTHLSDLPSYLALQLPFMQVSESMGNHDSKIVDAASVD